MKRFVLFLLVLFISFSAFSNTKLETANKYYDADDYYMAVTHFRSMIIDNEYTPFVLYKFAYSCEQIYGLTEEIKTFYAASLHLFTKEKSFTSKTYDAAVRKVKNTKPELIKITDKQFKKYISCMKTYRVRKSTSNKQINSQKKKGWLHFVETRGFEAFIIAFIIGLVSFLIFKDTEDSTGMFSTIFALIWIICAIFNFVIIITCGILIFQAIGIGNIIAIILILLFLGLPVTFVVVI